MLKVGEKKKKVDNYWCWWSVCWEWPWNLSFSCWSSFFFFFLRVLLVKFYFNVNVVGWFEVRSTINYGITKANHPVLILNPLLCPKFKFLPIQFVGNDNWLYNIIFPCHMFSTLDSLFSTQPTQLKPS